MGAPGNPCPNCGRIGRAGEAFCGYCGFQLGAPGTSTPYPVPPAPGDWRAPAAPTGPRAGQTLTGLLLMVLAFALVWIPIADFAGGILALVGVIYLWNGRRELGAVHGREVRTAAILLLAGFVVGVAGSIVLVAATVALTLTFNGTQPVVTHPAVSLGLRAVIVGTLTVGGALVAFCWVKLPYSLADPSARRLLLVGGGLTVAISALYAAAEVQAAATFASLLDTGSTGGPLPSPTVVGLLLVVPDALFAVVYYRVRARLRAGALPESAASVSPAR